MGFLCAKEFADVSGGEPPTGSFKLLGYWIYRKMKTYKFGTLEVLAHNLKPTKSWKEANDSCQKLGEGWRLPTVGELNYLFEFYKMDLLNLDLKGDDFVGYWSNETNLDEPVDDTDNSYFDCFIYYFRTIDGDEDIVWEPSEGSVEYEVRPVRTI